MATKFQTVNLRNKTNGSTVSGEFVVESSTAWQIAVGGKVSAFQKAEWDPFVPEKADVFGGMFGSGFGR